MGEFIRFGGLSPLKQKHYIPDSDPDKDFHNPPRKKGFYAFRKEYIEYFLLGATDDPSHVSGKSAWLKDDNGNIVVAEYDDIDEDTDKIVYVQSIRKLLKKRKIPASHTRCTRIKKIDKYACDDNYDIDCDECYMQKECKTFYVSYLKNPKKFKYDGEIWHHHDAYVKPEDVLARSGSWVKTTMKVYEQAFKKDVHKSNQTMTKEYGTTSNFKPTNWIPSNPYKRSYPGITYSKDHLEVFIERLK